MLLSEKMCYGIRMKGTDISKIHHGKEKLSVGDSLARVAMH